MFALFGYLVALKNSHQRETSASWDNHQAREWMQQIKVGDTCLERQSSKRTKISDWGLHSPVRKR